MHNDIHVVSSEQKMLFDIRQLLIEINNKLEKNSCDVVIPDKNIEVPIVTKNPIKRGGKR